MARRRARALQVSAGLTLPLESVAHTFAILAVRGAGKSSLGAVMAEEMYDHGLPWVVIDPKGDYWGLRSSEDGQGPGLAVPVFGGLHGDIPLEEGSGAMIAELVFEENLTCILDVSDFHSKAAQMRFLTDFAERLFRLHGKTPTARHIFLEEADEIIPQRVFANQARCVGAWSKLVKQGRQRGLGITLLSQRSAVVNKDALTQMDTLIALRTTSPQDRKAILGWVDYHAVGRELVESLPSLENGEAWVVSPQFLHTVERVYFRRRRTFDSGATPLPGAVRRPATLADIDIGLLRERMAGTIEHAQASDPAILARRLADTETQLAAALRARPTPERVVETVTVEVPDPTAQANLDALRHQVADAAAQLRAEIAHTAARLTTLVDDLGRPGTATGLAALPPARRAPARNPAPAPPAPSPAAGPTLTVPSLPAQAACPKRSGRYSASWRSIPTAEPNANWPCRPATRPAAAGSTTPCPGCAPPK